MNPLRTLSAGLDRLRGQQVQPGAALRPMPAWLGYWPAAASLTVFAFARSAGGPTAAWSSATPWPGWPASTSPRAGGGGLRAAGRGRLRRAGPDVLVGVGHRQPRRARRPAPGHGRADRRHRLRGRHLPGRHLGQPALPPGPDRRLGRGPAGSPLRAHPLPIVVGYTLAHYFSLLVLQGQNGHIRASDPFGLGWDLFGTASWVQNPLAVSTAAIAPVQITAIVTGHMAGVVAAHDRAMATFRGRDRLRGQYLLFATMVCYTVGVIALLVRT